MTEPLEFSGNTGRFRHGLVVSGVTGLLAIALLLFGGGVAEYHEAIGLVLLVVAGAVAFMAYRQQTGPADLRLDAGGLWCAEWDLLVPWREIEDCYLGGSRLRPLLVLKLKDPQSFIAGLTPAMREKLTSSPYIRLPELRIPASAAGDQLLLLRDLVQSKIGEGQE